jgi:hypothetical protein
MCPNKSSKEWKILVEKYGKDRAEEMYIENGYEIPVEDIEESVFKTDYNGKEVISGIHTRMLSHQAPKIFEEIVDKLKQLYPRIRIFKDGLFDKNGNWVQIQPGEKGMHYRNAFVSAVAWANDSYLETPPHEYAHDYIDMFRDHPLVQEGIQKYGEERLVSIMGRYFANQVISKGTENYINKFWHFIRSIFGNPDVAYILSKKFYEGEALSANSYAGSGIIRYQKSQIDKYKNQKGYLDLNKNEYQAETKQLISLNQARLNLLAKLQGKGIENELIFLGENNTPIYDVNKSIRFLLSYLEMFFTQEEYTGTKGLDKDTLSIMKLQLGVDGFSEAQILMLLEGINESKPIGDKKVKQFYDRLMMIEQANDFLQYKNKIKLGNNQYVDVESMRDDVAKEIDEHLEQREKRFAKIKNPFFKQMVKNLEKVSRLLMNSKLIAKTLTGSEESKLYRIFYKSLNWAERNRQQLLNQFDDIIKGNWVKEKNGSIYLKGGKTIDDVESKEFRFKTKGNKDINVKLTTAETICLYMILRQDELGPSNEVSPRQNLMNDGFVLEKELNRGITDATVLKLDTDIETDIINYVEQNHAEFVAKIDEAMKFMYEKVNETHKQESGFDLGKVKNYFPVYHKFESTSKGGAKSVITEQRQLNMRLGGGVIKITDVNQVVNQYKSSSTLYTAYAIPLENNKKIVKGMVDRYKGTNVEVFVKQWERDLQRIDDNLIIYPTNADSVVDKWINQATNNFSVSVLGMNLTVALKQTVSFMAASNYIDSKYLRKAGYGIGGMVTINPKSFIKFLTVTGVEKSDNIMDLLPVKLKMKENDPIYQEIIKSSPKLSYRFKGVVSKEAGEILMDPAYNDVISIKIPGTKKVIRTTKSRLMLWITMMDAATITDIWKSVKYEAIDLGLKEGTPEFLEYVANRTEEIVDLTQPTFDMVNRAELISI